MDFLPIFIDIKGKLCLVIGGGEVAARKASLLLKAGFNALGGGDGRGLFSFLSGNLSNSTGGGSIITSRRIGVAN